MKKYSMSMDRITILTGHLLIYRFKFIYRFNAISIKISQVKFVDINQLSLKLQWRGKRPQIANTIVKEKSTVEILTSRFKSSCSNQDSMVLTRKYIGTASMKSSVAQLCLTLCDPMKCSTPDHPVHYQLLESTQTHVN